MQTRSKPIPIAYLARRRRWAWAGGRRPGVRGHVQLRSGQRHVERRPAGSACTSAWSRGPARRQRVRRGARARERGQRRRTRLERTITTAQAFRGLEDQDVVVYRTVPSVQWRGRSRSSSTGVGAGTRSVDLPTDGIVTSAASVTSLARKYPDLFGPTGQLRPAVDQIFSHDVGDPGSC